MANDPKSGYDVTSQLTTLAKQKAKTQLNTAVEDIKTQAGNKAVETAKNASAKLQQKLGNKGLGAVQSLGGLGNLGDKVSEGLSSLVNSKLVDTIFTAGPLDDLLAVDAYGIKDSNILNSLVGKLTGFATDSLDNFRLSPGLISDVVNMATSGGGFKIDAKALTDRVVSSLGGSQGILRNVSTSLQDTFTQGFGIPSNIYQEVVGVVAGVTRDFNTGNMKDARGLFNMINQITGNNKLAEFFDVGAEANLLSGVFSEAIRLGVPDAIETMVTQSKSKKAADYALRANVVVAVSYSDVATTALMLDQLGAARVKADLPDAAKRLLSNYAFPAETTPDEYAAQYTLLKEVMDQLEPGWGFYSRDGQQVNDLTLFATASEDARTLLAMQPEFAEAALIAPSYSTVPLMSSLKSKYPMAAF